MVEQIEEKEELETSQPVESEVEDMEAVTADVAGTVVESAELEEEVPASVMLPGAEASAEEMAEFYRQLGRPDKADDYDLGLDPENMQEWHQEVSGKFKEIAHESGLTPTQARNLFEKYSEVVNGDISNTIQARKEAKENCLVELKKRHGVDQQNVIKKAAQVASKFGFYDELVHSDLGNNAAVLSMLADYAGMKGMEFAPSRGVAGKVSQVGVDERIAELRSKSDYGRANAVGVKIKKELSELYNRKYSLR